MKRPDLSRRSALLALAGMPLLALGAPQRVLQHVPQTLVTPAVCGGGWPAWESFKRRLLSKDGRVIDPSLDTQGTTSEGQSYALFFALVANDRAAFARILEWTENNLADGDLTARLPAWLWGRKPDGGWGVIDGNSASDSDLWIAYALGEAGRLWRQRRYIAMSALLANRILEAETADLPGLGPTLLPGPQGFVPMPGLWRLNPSYLPLQLMQWFSDNNSDPRWEQLLHSARRVIYESSPQGYVPDWILYAADKGFLPDGGGTEKGEGAYNAIRVYLWAGMLAEDGADRAALLTHLAPMRAYIEREGVPPESIDIATGVAARAGSSGFSAAMLPFLAASGAERAVREQLQRVQAQPIAADAYYDQVLGLFGQGWMERRYRFDAGGRLLPAWRECR
ncbi:hypothetical protein GCM10007205_08090 [Oxalicibacterium flavum]|uniref:cellulase n=1 Tax=Oxalicibacterium flavum TaxID=179467 RepID=A0A8J2UMZ8_9BURK|nr:cellulose synthase complex periplasmic endoglucanase BcsZ [Oxalicibacterium flavum]GGC01165.1 hypothetical protein GCM10007205_08090 [Oxalicibacterium flavum]